MGNIQKINNKQGSLCLDEAEQAGEDQNRLDRFRAGLESDRRGTDRGVKVTAHNSSFS